MNILKIFLGIEPFKKAIQNNQVNDVKYYLNWGFDPSMEQNFAIRYASFHGNIEIVRLLLTNDRVDPSDFDNQAIRAACENGHVEIARLLLDDSRVNPTDRDNISIIIACQNGHVGIVKLLLADGRADPTARGNEPIICACNNYHYKIVLLLLKDKRVNPSEQNFVRVYYNFTVLYFDIINLGDMLLKVKNGDADTIKDETIRERFIQWQYRIGGEKWAKAKDIFQKNDFISLPLAEFDGTSSLRSSIPLKK